MESSDVVHKFYETDCKKLSQQIDSVLHNLRERENAMAACSEDMSLAVLAQKDAIQSAWSTQNALQEALSEGDRTAEHIMFLQRRVGRVQLSTSPCIADQDNCRFHRSEPWKLSWVVAFLNVQLYQVNRHTVRFIGVMTDHDRVQD